MNQLLRRWQHIAKGDGAVHQLPSLVHMTRMSPRKKTRRCHANLSLWDNLTTSYPLMRETQSSMSESITIRRFFVPSIDSPSTVC